MTGGSGAIGSRLLRELGERGWRRRSLVHRSPVADADEHTRGELADVAALTRAADGASAVVHLAAVTHARSSKRYDEINAAGTANLVAAAQSCGAERFLLVSTRAISPSGGAYSRSKLRAEEHVSASELDWTIVRLPEVYGAGGTEGVDRIVELARRGRRVPLVGGGDDVLCPAHVDDVVPALAQALEAPLAHRKTYTLAGPCVTARELAELAGQSFGRGARPFSVPVAVVATAALASRVLPLPLYPDQLERLRSDKPVASAEAARELGFAPRALRDGLGRLADESR